MASSMLQECERYTFILAMMTRDASYRPKRAIQAVLHSWSLFPWEQYPGQWDEQAVLGAIFRYGMPALLEAGNLNSTCFFDGKHRFIYAAQREQMSGSDTIDRVFSVADELDRTGRLHCVGSYIYLAELEDLSPFTAEIAPWAARVFDRWKGREARLRSCEVNERLNRGHGLDEVLMEAVSRLDTLRTLNHRPYRRTV